MERWAHNNSTRKRKVVRFSRMVGSLGEMVNKSQCVEIEHNQARP